MNNDGFQDYNSNKGVYPPIPRSISKGEIKLAQNIRERYLNQAGA
jgi:hypothetical protein